MHAGIQTNIFNLYREALAYIHQIGQYRCSMLSKSTGQQKTDTPIVTIQNTSATIQNILGFFLGEWMGAELSFRRTHNPIVNSSPNPCLK